MLAVFSGAPAQAATVTNSTLTIVLLPLPTLSLDQAADPIGVSTVGGATIVQAGGTFSGTATGPLSLLTGIPLISEFSAVVQNGSGTLAVGGGPQGGFGGTAPVSGVAVLNLLNLFDLSVPLSPVGNAPGATAMEQAGGVQVTLVGGAWTTGAVVLTGLSVATSQGVVNTITFTGSDGRANGLGSVTLIAPLKMITGFGGTLGGFVSMQLNFVPEPGTSLLLGSGVAVLAAVGARRRRARDQE
ncbi:MAG: PEP-CTERM sorting domain-containing protein [Proteobacteria bacterium]|nr:PEP-CTERM sorting domain-containing protein [Pseudomonadota bacterium]